VIVTCESCETQFQLDDAKVPEGGIRVRCSRCKHAFFVESPRAPDQDRAEVLAREALEREGAAASSDFGPEDDESDWQFNEDVNADSAAIGERRAARSAVDDLLGDSARSESTPQPQEDIGIDVGRDLLESEGFELGGSDLDVPDLSSEIETGPIDDLSAADSPFADHEAEDLGAVGDDAGALDSPPDEATSAAPVGLSGLDAFLGEDDSASGFGSNEEWDLGEDEPSPSAGTPIGRIVQPLPTEAARAPERLGSERRLVDESAFDLDSEAVPEAAWLARARAALLCAGITGDAAWASSRVRGPRIECSLYDL